MRLGSLRTSLRCAACAVAFLVAGLGCGGAPSDGSTADEGVATRPPGGTGVAELRAAPGAEIAAMDTAYSATEEDWQILRQTVERAWGEGLDTLPIGENVVGIARWFVGVPYTPKTLDPPGPERLVVNLREFDCVTLVESVLALTHFARTAPRNVFDDPGAANARYRRQLAAIRYRDGMSGDYLDRLHYFSEWLSDNDLRGIVSMMAAELGGVADEEPIDFMTTHPDAYAQLADPSVVAALRSVEERLNARPRLFIPQDRIAASAGGIQNGDVIAATSTVAGLDVAHTGIAIWVDGALHLLHAPLVGSVVEISETPLAERIQGFSGQDGIMVARPVDRQN